MAGFGIPQVDFYSALSGIGDTLQNNAKLQREQRLRDSFKDGLPKAADGSIDFNAIGNIASQHGADLGTTLTIAKLSEEQRKSREELSASAGFRNSLSGILGGKTAETSSSVAQPSYANTPATSQVPSVQPNDAPRASVQPSPKVWGDKEAEDAGLYEKPATVSFGDALSGKKPVPPIMQPQQPDAQPSQPVQAAQPIQPAQSSGFQELGAQHVPALIAAAANPRLPSSDRELAGKLLTRALDSSKEPDKIRTLSALKEQSGYPGTILQLEMELRKAGKTDVTVDQRGENEEAKTAGKAAGERRGAMFAAADKATNNLASLTRVQTLLDQVDQGKLAPSRMTISAWAKSLGVNDDFAKGLGLDPAKVGNTQALQAMTNELVLGKIGPGGLPSNNFSDADRQFLTDTLPKLGNDPRANKILIESARRVNQTNIQRALDYQTWKEDPANKGKSFEDFEFGGARRTSQMDRFGDLRKQSEDLISSTAPAAPSSPAIPQAPQNDAVQSPPASQGVSRQNVPWKVIP